MGEVFDSELVVADGSLNHPVKKMIVKRPIKAEPFDAGINYQVTGKTTRYDVYI